MCENKLQERIYKLLQLIGLISNGYYLMHMVMLNVWLGEGITAFAIWKQCLFLTNITHILIFIYHVISLLAQSCKYSQSVYLKKYYQFLFNLSTLVTIIYWILRSIDQRLIHGTYTPNELGSVYIIFIHGVNHFLLFLEVFIEDKTNQFQSSFKQFAGFMLGYSLLSAIQQFYFHKHVYAFYKLVSPYGFLLPLASIPVLIAIDTFYTQNVFAHFSLQAIEEQPFKSRRKKYN